MADGGSKWTPGKIFLLVIGILAGLGIICCGGFYFLAGDKIRGVAGMVMNSVAFQQRLQKDFGSAATFELLPDGKSFILAVGISDDLTPERIVQVQDGTWKALAEVYAKEGFVHVSQVAVGKAELPNARGTGKVSNWAQHMVATDELVKRTGVAGPPLASFLPEEMDGSHVKVRVTATPDAKDGAKEEDGGGEGK